MIVYKDILKKLSAAGWSTYRLYHERQLPNSVIGRLRNGDAISTDTLGKICKLLDCQPGDILSYVPDEQGE
jgi:putative transcriptional regulator